MKTPVLFLIFNRPETTYRVFEAIRAYQPEELFIAADGPRLHKEGEKALCEEVRRVADLVDWECKVHTLFRTENLGCKYAVSGAIDWFFSQVEEGIILEDDCLPCPDFFRFCEEMLHRYRNEEKVMHIGGTNVQDGIRRGKADYYYSRIAHVWGWATWRRAWRHYDVEMRDFPAYFRNKKDWNLFEGGKYMQWRFLLLFFRTWQNSPCFNTWDWQWNYALIKRKAFSIIPNVNLVSNVGGTSTHTVDPHLCDRQCGSLPGKLHHPGRKCYDGIADAYSFCKIYKGTWKDRIRFWADRLHLSDTFSEIRHEPKEKTDHSHGQ